MRSIASTLLLGCILCSGAAGAAAKDAEGGTVHVNGIRKPETHTYRTIAARTDPLSAVPAGDDGEALPSNLSSKDAAP